METRPVMALSRYGYFTVSRVRVARTYHIITDVAHQLGILLAIFDGLFGGWSHKSKPEVCVVDAEIRRDIEILAVVQETDVEVEWRGRPRRLRANEEVTVMRVRVEEAVQVYHLRKDARKLLANLVAIDLVTLEIGEVIDAGSLNKLHHQAATFCPQHLRDVEARLAFKMLEVLATAQ